MPEERAHLAESLLRFSDVEEKPEGFFIKSGMTIDAPSYLNISGEHVRKELCSTSRG